MAGMIQLFCQAPATFSAEYCPILRFVVVGAQQAWTIRDSTLRTTDKLVVCNIKENQRLQ
jgi:hypothetical protein